MSITIGNINISGDSTIRIIGNTNEITIAAKPSNQPKPLKPLNVIIAGSYNYKNYEMLEYICDAILDRHEDRQINIVAGKVSGVESLAFKYAKKRSFDFIDISFRTEFHGGRAEAIRYYELVENADMMIMIWDEKDPSLTRLFEQAQNKGLTIFSYNDNLVFKGE